MVVGGWKCFIVAESVMKMHKYHFLQKIKAPHLTSGAEVQKKLIYKGRKLALWQAKVHRITF